MALAQTQIVIAALQERWCGLACRAQVVATRGDQDQGTALWDLPRTLRPEGFFTSALEQALLAGEADAAVHSFKDLPTRPVPGLQVAAVCSRQYPEDCLVTSCGRTSLEDLPQGARIGTSSLRRAAQVRHRRSDLQIVPMRGNVETRLSKLDAGQVDALVLARAGLERLDLAGRISSVLDPRQFIPAAAQGALAVQVRQDDPETREWVTAIDHAHARLLAETEREVLISTGCGCHAPVGAFAEIEGDALCLHACMADPGCAHLIHRHAKGPLDQYLAVARQTAEDLARAVAC